MKKIDTEMKVIFDSSRTPELELEGFINELTRYIQQTRKENGFIKEDIIDLYVDCELPEDISYFDFIEKMIQNKKRLNFDVFSMDIPYLTGIMKTLEKKSPWNNIVKFNILIVKK